MLYFPSKRDMSSSVILVGQILFFIFLHFLIFGWQIIHSMFGYLLYGIIIVMLLLSIWVWVRTGYKIEKGSVQITSGPFRKTIQIDEIKTVSTHKTFIGAVGFFSGPALSIHQLEILYGPDHDVINISPKNKDNFMRTIVAENPHVRIDPNKSKE